MNLPASSSISAISPTPGGFRRPDFMIIGGMKCGTSSLGRTLNRHPSIYLANDGGEVHFISGSQHYDKGMDWYLRHFPEQQGMVRYGDKTPAYMDTKHHGRLHLHFPEVKLIVILRDPVRRFQSHYNYAQRTAVRDHLRARHAREFRIEYLDERKAIDRRIWERGLYVEQLESLFRFYPREQVHICFLDDFKEGEQEEYNRIYKFLQVPRHPVESVIINRQESYLYPFGETVLKQLYERYQPYNERLFKLLGTERMEWRKYAS